MADRRDVGRRRWGTLGAMVTGVLLFVLAASGGFAWGGIEVRIETGSAQILVSALGVVLLAAGVLLLAEDGGSRQQRRARPTKRRDAPGYEIKILRPARYHRRMRIEGWFAVPPPEGMLRLFTVHEDGRFRPQSIATIDESEHHWMGEVDLGPGPYYSVYVVAALVEGAGAVLWDYYFQVGEQTEWEPVAAEFGDHAVACDRFLVEGAIYE